LTESFTVFVRFAGEKTARRLTPDGGTTRRRVHAALIDSRSKADPIAIECQEYLDRHHPGSTAWAASF
jgi:hypothetical protein